MTSLDRRIASLSGRTSREAWVMLKRIRHHPKFAGVLEYLEGIEGQVLGSHVEQGAQIFLDTDDHDKEPG